MMCRELWALSTTGYEYSRDSGILSITLPSQNTQTSVLIVKWNSGLRSIGVRLIAPKSNTMSINKNASLSMRFDRTIRNEQSELQKS